MRKPLLVAALLVTTPFFAACTENAKDDGGESGDARTVSVTSTDDACKVSAAKVPSGTVTFDVTNDGSQVTEFYLLGEDGLRIVAEVENVGPQLSRQLVVNAPAGTYFTACKPGMKGDGIRADFTVTKSGDEPTVSADDQAAGRHRADQLLGVRPGPVRPAGGQDAGVRRRSTRPATTTRRARSTPRPAPTGSASRPWPSRSVTSTRKTDAREADLEPGQKWTGWHRIEKDLWPAAGEELHAADAGGARVLR